MTPFGSQQAAIQITYQYDRLHTGLTLRYPPVINTQISGLPCTIIIHPLVVSKPGRSRVGVLALVSLSDFH